MNQGIGAKIWVFADGYIPSWSNGPAPEMESHETASVLNTGPDDTEVRLTFYFTDREPVGPYRVRVGARRTVHIRLSSLTDPEPLPHGTEYACVIESDHPVVVQQSRLDSRQAENTVFSTIAYPIG